MWDAEVERVRGVILASGCKPDCEASEGAYRLSLEIARRQKARALELRTAVSYARLLQLVNRPAEGYDLLKTFLDRLPSGETAKHAYDARAMLKVFEEGQ